MDDKTPASTTDKKCIFVVEDYAPSVVVVTYFLDELGYDYDVARDGREAVEKFERSRYAAVLMDIQMPEMDGMEAIRHIRKFEEQKGMAHTPIVPMTGRITEDDRFLCRKMGIDNLLGKPFDKAQLKDILDAIIV